MSADVVYRVGTRTGSPRVIHKNEDCPAIKQAVNVQEHPADAFPERYGRCSRCFGDGSDRTAVEQDGPIMGTDHDSRVSVSNRECHAMQLLYEDGWSLGELAMTFQAAENTVRNHAHDRCSHRHTHTTEVTN
jgi:hypothetical protein